MNKTANISAMIAAAAFGSINLFGCKSDDTDTANEKELEMLKKAVDDYTTAAAAQKADKCDAVRTKFDAEHKKWEDKYKDMFSKMSSDDKKAADEKWKSKIDEQKTKMNEARGKCYAAGGKKDPVAGSGGSPEKLTAAEKKEKAEVWFKAHKKEILEPYTKKLNELKADTAKSSAEREQALKQILADYEETLNGPDFEGQKWQKNYAAFGIKKEDLEQLAGGTNKEPVASYNMALSKFQTAVDECREAVSGIDEATVQDFFTEKAIKFAAWTQAYEDATDDDAATSAADKKTKCDAVDCDYEPLQAGADQATAENPAWLKHFYELSDDRQQELLGDEIADVAAAEEAFKQAKGSCYASAYFADEANKAKATTYMTAAGAILEDYTTKLSAPEVTKLSGNALGVKSAEISTEAYTKLAELASKDENKEVVDNMKAVDIPSEDASADTPIEEVHASLGEVVGADAFTAYVTKQKAFDDLQRERGHLVTFSTNGVISLYMFADQDAVKHCKEHLAKIAPDNQPEPEQSPKNSRGKKRSGSRRKSKSGNIGPDGNGF